MFHSAVRKSLLVLAAFFMFSSIIGGMVCKVVKKSSLWREKEWIGGFYAAFFIFAIIFLMLKAVAKKAKSIVTLSVPK